MKIGINLYPLKKEKGGIEVFGENLLKSLSKNKSKNEEFLFFGKETHYRGLKRIYYEQVILPRELQRKKIDLLLNITCSGPLRWKGKQITAVYDLAYLRFPETKNIFAKIYFGLTFRILPKKSLYVITSSEFSKKEIHQLLRISLKKIIVIPGALPQEFLKIKITSEEKEEILKKFKIKKPYLLYLGIRRPRKNVERLKEAFSLVKKEKPDLQLVLAGEKGKEKIKEEGIVETGWVNLKEKRILYQEAEILVFPSIYEGFGLPILEAQSSGIPVLTSNTSSLPEVGGNSVLYVDPYDVKNIVQGMKRLLINKDLRKDLINKGYENIKRFSWQKAASQLLNLIHSL